MTGVIKSGAKSQQDSLSSMLEEYTPSRPCQRGDIVKGAIVRVSPKCILVDIGGKCDAMIHPQEVERMDPSDFHALRPGQTIHVYVVDSGDKDNVIIVSRAQALQQGDWLQAQELLDSGETVNLEVIDTNQGGVIVCLGQLRGFVPGSQLSASWHSQQNKGEPERRWNTLIEQTLKLKVIEVTPQRNRLIFSERKADAGKESKRALLKDLQPGMVVEGVVSNVVNFGAFVNVNGVDGLLHISELSWQRIKHPTDVVRKGQKLKVHILDIDLERGRLGLSLKQLLPSPWEGVAETYHEGQLVEVKIVNLTSFGAFASPIDTPGVEGLIHLSELCDHPVSRPDEVVQVGMRKLARIISLQPKSRRLAFSLKQVPADAALEEGPPAAGEEPKLEE